jgi:geranylgeranyl pyrophosphate synthase
VSFADFVAIRRREIEDALVRCAAWSETPAIVADAMRYSLLAGGKRLRPLLTLAAAEAAAQRAITPPEEAVALALPAACAIEMIHTYSLIHDDLPAMDNDVLRRGRATLHVVSGDGMAILAGDGLQAAAFGLMAHEPVSDDPSVTSRKLRVIALVADAAGPAGMVGGQAIDLDAVRPGPSRTPHTLDQAAVGDMHARKTGALIRAAAVAGAVMGGASTAVIAAIDRFGSEIGLAFQIVDDLLDIEAASETLGKTAGKDRVAAKPTYPSLFGVDVSRRLAAECLARAQDALGTAGLDQSHLPDIARWVAVRQH